MSYDARQIANDFIRRAAADNSRVLSIMTLLKLVYIAHGWTLALYDRALISNKIEAWQRGPVIPDVYNAFRGQGVHIDHQISFDGPNIDRQTNKLLGEIYDIYGDMSPFKLSDLTHVAGGPWELATRIGGNYAPIPNDLIKSHYAEKQQA